MNGKSSQNRPDAQAGQPGEAKGIGAAVGVLRSSEEAPVMGVERRRGTRPNVRGGCGRRPRKGIRRYDAKSPILTVTEVARPRWNRTRKAGYGKPVRPV